MLYLSLGNPTNELLLQNLQTLHLILRPLKGIFLFETRPYVEQPVARKPREVYRLDISVQNLDHCQICGAIQRHRCTEYGLTKNSKNRDNPGK